MVEELVIATDRGTITAPIKAGGSVLSDSTKLWKDNIFRNYLVRVTGPTGGRELAVVGDNIKSTLVIRGSWLSSYPVGSVYELLAIGDLRQALRDVFGGGSDIDIPTELANLSKLIPIAKAAIFNTALPAAEANWLGSDIEPTNSPSYLRIYACVSATGILRVARTVSAVTVTEDLNSGTALVADAAYMFTVPWRTGDSINIRYSVTTGTIKRLLIDEIGGAE